MSKIVVKQSRAYDVLRQEKFRTIAAAAKLSGPTVSRVFRGEACQIKTARKICNAIGCQFADLFEIKKEVRVHE